MHVIGGKTDIDSSNLTLSKAQGTEDDTVPYMTIAALNGDDVFIDKDEEINNMANTGGTALTIKGSELNSSQNIALYGNSVALTDTKLQTSESNENNTIDILAYGLDEGDNSVTNADGFIKVTGGSIVSTSGDIFMLGSNISLDGVTEMKAAKDRGIALIAGKDIDLSKDAPTLTNTTDANAISVKNTTMDTKGPVAFIGGKVDVSGSNVTTRDFEVSAGTSYTNNGNSVTGNDATNISISDSTINSAEDVTFTGSNIDFANTKLTVGTSTDQDSKRNGVVRVTAGKDVTLTDNGNSCVVSEVNNTGNVSLDGVTLTALGNVDVYGKTVAVKDSNLSTNNVDGAELSLNALQHYQRKDGSDDTWVATKDNTLSVTNSKLQNNDFVELAGGNVTLDKSEIKAGDTSIAARSGYESVATDKNNDTTVIRHTAADGMNVVIKDSTVTSDSGLDITGHDVTIDGKSNMSAKDFLAVGTGTDVTIDFEKNTVTANGKAVKVSPDAQFQSSNKVIKPGTEIIENTKPSDKPIVTPDPKPAVDIEKNIEQGKQDMTKVLADNPDQTVVAAKQQAEKLSNSDMTAEEKAAQFKGYADAIQETQATAEEKQDLIKETVKSFEPTQQAGLEAQNKQDEAAQNQNAKAVIPDVAVKTDSPAAHEHVAAEVTVDGQAVHE